MLSVEQLHAFQGRSHILHGVDLSVQPGQIVALLGRNGSGRSTTAQALMGLVEARGHAEWNGRRLLGLPPHEIARLGVGYVPEGRDVFPRLTVHQNLLLGQKPGRLAGRWSFDDMYRLFPALAARRDTAAGVLSGGEQQMLTLCRTLMGDPGLMLVDEPTEGLAPQVVAQLRQFLGTLRERGVAVLLIEQKLTLALEVSDRALVMGHGKIVFAGTSAELQAADGIRSEWLEI